jgi:hypothetical protein
LHAPALHVPPAAYVRNVVDETHVGDGAALHILGVPVQVPPLHVSWSVQALPSSQGSPSCAQVIAAPHLPLVHVWPLGHAAGADQFRQPSPSNFPQVRTATALSHVVWPVVHSSAHCAAHMPFEQNAALAGHGVASDHARQPLLCT